MEINSLQPKVQASKIPLEKLAGNTSLSEAEKNAEVSRQFEAILLRQILQEAQKPVFKSTVTQDSLANGIYQDMIVTQMADGVSHSGGFGLADSFKSQLARQTGAVGKTPAASPAGSPSLTLKKP